MPIWKWDAIVGCWQDWEWTKDFVHHQDRGVVVEDANSALLLLVSWILSIVSLVIKNVLWSPSKGCCQTAKQKNLTRSILIWGDLGSFHLLPVPKTEVRILHVHSMCQRQKFSV